jgi:TP901 family phage tail tape measure protein
VQSLSHASGVEMQALTDAALHMGQGIGFSATEVADAEIELVKAGISVKDIMGGALAGSLTLAAAGQISVADATEIATIAMTQFGLAGKDIPHVADLLSAGADKALGGVSELGWALKTGGLVAHQFGLSLDDTVGTLALFAQNGLMGEAAGTDLRQMLLKLAAPSKTATADMEKLGMTMYDSQGHFVGITSLAGQLHDKMGKLSESERNAMEAHIFGARSIVGANILYQAGAKGVQGWIDAVNDSGFAAKQAAGKMDSMSGDVKKLQAAWQTSMIEMGSASDSFVRPVIQGVTHVIQGFESLPESTKGTILGFGAVIGSAALLGGAFLTITPKVLDVVQAFHTLDGDGNKVATTFGKVAKGAGIAAAAIGVTIAVATAMDAAMSKGAAAPSMEQMTDSVLKLSKASKSANLDSLFKNWDSGIMKAAPVDVNNLGDAVRRLTHEDGLDGFNKVVTGIVSLGSGTTGLEQVEARMKGLGDTLGNLVTSGSLPEAAKGFNTLSAEYVKNGKSATDALNAVPAYRDALLAQAHAANVSLQPNDLLAYAAGKIPAVLAAATASYGSYKDALGNAQPVTADMSKALDAVGISAEGDVTSMDKLITSFAQAGLISISADGAAIAYHKALDDLSASIAKNGRTLDINTDAGRANRTALDAIASSGLALVQANAKNGDSQQSLTKNMHTTYDALVAGAGQFGITGDAADTLARKALGIPKGVKIDTAIGNFIDTQLKLLGIKTAADNLNGKTVDVWVNTHLNSIYSEQHVSNGQGGGGGQTHSEGGSVYRAMGGPIGAQYLAAGGHSLGPIGTDTVKAWLTPGEFVVKRSSVQSIGAPAMNYMNSTGHLPPAGAPSYRGAPSYQSAASSGAPVVNNYYITGQSNPIATAHEVTRRQTALAA